MRTLILLLLANGVVFGQGGPSGPGPVPFQFRVVSTDPSGTCSNASLPYFSTQAGTGGPFFGCGNGTIAKIGQGGTVTAITGTGPITATGTTSVTIACPTCVTWTNYAVTIANGGSGAITMTTPSTSFTAARADAGQTFTGSQTFSSQILGQGGFNDATGQTAISGTNYSSAGYIAQGSYYNGSAGANDVWTIKNVLSTGTNPTSTLTFSHSGSSGTSTVSLPGLTIAGGAQIITGSTATDSASLGAELTTSGGTTSTGWTGTFPTFTNGASNTSPLTYTISGIGSGQLYQLVFTLSSVTGGTVDVSIGGTDLGNYGSNGTTTIGPKTVSSAALIVTPTSSFAGTFTISVKRITAIPSYYLTLTDSTGAVSLQVGQYLASLNNSSVGRNALLNNTTGNQNSAQGVSALQNNTTGVQNSAQGVAALLSNTTGSLNSAQGVSALQNNTTGSQNSAQGVAALLNNTTGNQNSAQGVSALLSNTTGSLNSAQGVSALQNNTTGVQNSAQGVAALQSNTTGSLNSAQGVSALQNNTTGAQNSAQGAAALQSNTTGSLNSAQGYQAGYGTSATNANTTGSNNTFVGSYSAPGSSTQQTYMTVIGSSATASCNSCVQLGRAQDITYSAGYASSGTKFTISGCSAGTTVGGATAGSFSSGTTGTCTVTVTMDGATGLTAPNGWSCWASDTTTTADTILMTASTTTTATFSGTTVSGDVIKFGCVGY